MSAFVIPQVAGTVKRSHPVDGVAESLVKSKKYLLPLAILTPEVAGGAVVAYLAEGRMKLPRNATVFNVDDEETGPGQPWPFQPASSGGDRTPVPSPELSPASPPVNSPAPR
jgi:hypothetical protein